MIRSIFTLSLWVMLLLSSSVAIAETPQGSPADSKKNVSAAKPYKVYNPSTEFGQFSRDLDLSKQQQESIKPILADLEEKLAPLKKLTLQRRGRRGAPIAKEHYQKIREKLDSDQLAKFNKMVGRGEITPFVN